MPPTRRALAALLVGSIGLAAPAAAHDAPFFWSVAKVMRMADDARVRVGNTTVRIDEATTLCSGQGLWRRRNGVRRWRHFACTYSIITRQGVGRDLEFHVHVLGVRRFAITNARWVSGRR
jgi:hypothetical protein